MKTFILSLSIFYAGLGFSQGHVELSFSVVDVDTEKKLDSAFIHVYKGDSLLDKDSSGYYFGHFKSFWLEYGFQYSFHVSKEGYVSKMGTVDTRHPEPDSLPWKIYFPCFVSLFPDCDLADYDFLETTPLIEMYIDSTENQAWDKAYVKKMQMRIADASHEHLSDEIYNKYLNLYQGAQGLMEVGNYEEALQKLKEAQEIMDCYKVQRAITECSWRLDGMYNQDTLTNRAERRYLQKNYTRANRLYARLFLLFPEARTKKLDERNEFLAWLVLGVKAIEREDFSSAVYNLEKAKEHKLADQYTQEKYKEAVAGQEAWRKKRDEFDSLMRDGRTKEDKGNYIVALEYYRKAAVLFPKHYWPPEAIERVSEKLAKVEETVKKYEKLIQQADEYFDAEEYQKAYETYMEANFLMPDEKYPNDRIAECRAILKEKESKSTDDKGSQEIEEEKLDKKAKKADQKFRKGNYEKARALYLRASEQNPDNAFYRERLQDIDVLIEENR